MKKISESDLVLLLEKWLQSKGLKTNIEVPFCGAHTKSKHSRRGANWDLVAWDDTDRFLAIEVKMLFREEAIDQAVAMLPACREVYLAVHESSISNAMKYWPEINDDYGVGLISVCEDGCKIHYEAKHVFPSRENMVIEMLRISRELPRESTAPGKQRLLKTHSGWRWRKPRKPRHFIALGGCK